MTVERIYWDSDAFLGWLNNDPGKASKCDGVIQRAERGEVLIVTSALTLAECLWMRGQSKVPKNKAQIVQRFFKRSFIRVYNVTRKIGEDAQALVWDNGIKPKDAIHVATAIFLGVDALETFDADLIKKSGTVGSPLLKIRQPEAPRQGDLGL
ncbi:MAG: type II toxin-antitoxin system VapC family toxin [Methylobacterium sp.]|nr:type II toxin-antitoxin system VapC family toxin [Methylobacterium sp.]MCA3645399.1 type II toxin-antitoxin system VapC family toxin [Methylobacterium sp.]MCA3651862.1 type II toxin-antitoxin system VapC family toxin [Methylobacterium sp.]MCA4922080.1 type II toxin-antitoxin system VapC family toxin [Methylobacterium sp.]